MAKNYYSMTLQDLVRELRSRDLGDAQVYSELGKLYGVAHPPSQQVVARQEAIRRLQESDKSKLSLKKIAISVAGVAGFLAAVATIVGLLVSFNLL